MAYTNATFYIDLEGGSDAARTALTSVTVANNGAGLVRCTKTAHGLVTGAVVDVTLNYAGAWLLTVIDANNFDLVGSTYSTATAVTVTPRGGSSKADAWKSITSGATAARIAAGDTIRIMASPDETLVGNATWTSLSKTITLAGAVTATISACESAWTASANVTATAVATGKEGTNYANIAIASAFTTGKAAYFATGTLDLSAYQKISFWVRCDTAVATSTLSLRLCTDTIGATSVHTVAIPAIQNTGVWTPLTVDLATNLNAAIASIALYCDLDPGTINLRLDNLIACKASSSADALSLTSLIGKVWNRVWVASTTYAVGDIRKPTQPNRNGFRYKVMAQTGAAGSSEPTWPLELGVSVVDGGVTWQCEGLEDTWYGIQSISGTTVKLDNETNNAASNGRGYAGVTETVATYQRRATPMVLSTTQTVQNSGTAGNEITFSGGWNRTDMTTQTGETWMDGQNGSSLVVDTNGKNHLVLENLNAVRGMYGFRNAGGDATNTTYRNCHANNSAFHGVYCYYTTSPVKMVGCCANNNGSYGINWEDPMDASVWRVTASNNSNSGGALNDYGVHLSGNYFTAQNNGGAGLEAGAAGDTINLGNFVTGNNVSGGFAPPTFGAGQHYYFFNSLFAEATEFGNLAAFENGYIYSTKHDQTADNHLITTDGGTIISATDQRHTASGIAWKFRPTSTNRSIRYPLRLSVAKLACAANSAVNVQIWTRRDNTNINGTLKVAGGQIAGVPADVTVACAPSINSWTQSSTLSVTPTEAGVIEVIYEVYDGVGTANNFWIDDISVS